MHTLHHKTERLAVGVAVLMAALTIAGPAGAGVPTGTVVGGPLSTAVGQTVGNGVPIAEGGLLALLAGGVVGGVYLARRKR